MTWITALVIAAGTYKPVPVHPDPSWISPYYIGAVQLQRQRATPAPDGTFIIRDGRRFMAGPLRPIN